MTENNGQEKTPLPKDIPGVIAPPPLIFLGGLILGFALDRLLFPLPFFPERFGLVIGGLLVAAGLGLVYAAFRRMRRADTAVEPWKPSTAIVSDGPFAFSRNPIYLGMTITYAGLTILADSLWMAALLIPVLLIMEFGVIRREERYLETKFGEPYRDYRRKVRRWL